MFLFGKRNKKGTNQDNKRDRNVETQNSINNRPSKPQFSFSKIRNGENSEGLAGKTILLNWLNGKSASVTPIVKFSDDNIFHIDWKKEKNAFLEQGLLRYPNAEDSLGLLGNPDLKDILKSNGQKVSGNKKDLIQRIKDTISPDSYSEKIPKFFKLTQDGSNLLDKNAKVLWADKHGNPYVDTQLPEAARIDPISFVKKIGNGKTVEEDAIECYEAAIDFHSKKFLYSQITFDFIGISKIYSLVGNNEKNIYYSIAASLLELSGMSHAYYALDPESDSDQYFFKQVIEQSVDEAKRYIENNEYNTRDKLIDAINKTQISEDSFAEVVGNVWKNIGTSLPNGGLLQNENQFAYALNKMINS
mgnify:CR=1 FL=1